MRKIPGETIRAELGQEGQEGRRPGGQEGEGQGTRKPEGSNNVE